MNRIKKNLGKILILLCACLSIGVVVNAEGKTSTDVEITIEAGTKDQDMRDVTKPEQTDGDAKITQKKSDMIKTGDNAAWLKYVVLLGAAIIVVISCIWKKKKGLLAVFALFITIFMMDDSVLAADTTENVNVTIPTNISISFDESGENSISKFDVNNQSLVPITIATINVTECNSWCLCQKGQKIPVNTKKLVFEIEGKTLTAGENLVSIPIEEQTSEAMELHVGRGAWTTASVKETALKLEFEYTIGQKEFQLQFDTNGSTQTVTTKTVCNGEVVELPTLQRDGYVFAGWEDEEGNLYIDQFVMPIGNVILKASWKKEIAYAIYSASDTSLRFIRSAETIQAGDTYNGRVVTNVFTGFEEDVYTSEAKVPWYDGQYYNKRIITKIIFEDVIKPKSTAHWFQWAADCTNMDVRKLDTSEVTSMAYMCRSAGKDAASFTITGMSDWDVSNVTNMEEAFNSMGFNSKTLKVDLSKWDVSKVTNMYDMFCCMGYYSTTFSLGDLSKWNVSNVKDMGSMFMQTGYSAKWSMNLSNWNVKNVVSYKCFALESESKIVQPKWVN